MPMADGDLNQRSPVHTWCHRTPLQGDRLSLAGTTWSRMLNSWGAKWELRRAAWVGRQRVWKAGCVAKPLPLPTKPRPTSISCFPSLPPFPLLPLRSPFSPCSGLPEGPLDLRVTSDRGEALVAR